MKNASLHVSPLTAEAFCASIEKALENPPDFGGSVERITRALNRLPEGKLFVSDNGSHATFFTEVDGKLKYLPKTSDQLLPLARRRYQSFLLNILKLTGSTKAADIKRREKLITRLQDFIRVCDKGNADIRRIILSNAQYRWFTSRFRQKIISADTPFHSKGGVPLRSKSERDILNGYEDFAVPVHYEEQMVVYVQPFVDMLEAELRESGELTGHLYSFNSRGIFWNVPTDLQWMNSRGSIWKTYYPPNGTISIFNDFKCMFADGSLFVHEHEGMMQSFRYRNNSTERAAIIKLAGAVSKENFLETYESEVDTREKVIDLIERLVLPRLWF